MIHDPVNQRILETDIMACFFGLEPFVTQYFVAFSLKFSVEREIFDCLFVARLRLVWCRHRSFYNYYR